MRLYPEEEMYQEMSFIAYYFHWSEDDILKLEHVSRRKWCSEISMINQKLNPSKKEKEKSILEMSPSK